MTTWYCAGKGGNCTVEVCPGAACEFYNGKGAWCVKTKGDAIRELTDEALVPRLLKLCRMLRKCDYYDLAELWCDGCGACITMDDNDECDEDAHKACILRYLQSPAEGST